jgi:hypothetical protein
MGAALVSTRFCGQEVTEAELVTVRQVVAEFPGLSRMELGATVCEVVGWLRPSGSPKARECREWLEGLDAAGLLVLPGKQRGRQVGAGIPVPVTSQGEPGLPLEGTVREVAPVLLERVTDRTERRLWRELVGRYHYLGHAVPFGAHLRYLVWASRPERAVVGCLQVSSPAWRMAARDQWLGWDDATRVRNLQRIVNNSRFLLLPWVQVKNLASHVLAELARRVGTDWLEQYGVEPFLLETLVNAERFAGTCYRAAGWTMLGSTTGRGRMDREHRKENLVPKLLFVKPLVQEVSARLREATPPPGASALPPEGRESMRVQPSATGGRR